MRVTFVLWSNLVLVFGDETPVLAPQCLSEWSNLIIRTTESIRNGAEFLDSQDDVTQEVNTSTLVPLRSVTHNLTKTPPRAQPSRS